MSERETGAVWALIQTWMDGMSYPPSQRKLAERVGVSPGLVSDWKYKDSMPAPDLVRALADEIGVRYERVLDAFLEDHGYILTRPTRDSGSEVRKHG